MVGRMTLTADSYKRWADIEARGSSSTYERWAREVSRSSALVALIDSLPRNKRQPNLVFAAARWNGAPLEVGSIAHWLQDHWPDVEATVLNRSTQTNEAARCAALMMALDQIAGPIALLELGASAGLCLLPDLYRYEYVSRHGSHILEPAVSALGPTVMCTLDAATAPVSIPDIVWRRGIDLNTVNLDEPAERLWLETLVWPEHHERRERLGKAIAVARALKPQVDRGDLIELLPTVAAEAPADATLVVFHSAVLAYLGPDDRSHAAQMMKETRARVVSLEGIGVLPEVAARIPESLRSDSRFLLVLDGRPLGLAAPHGESFAGIEGKASR